MPTGGYFAGERLSATHEQLWTTLCVSLYFGSSFHTCWWDDVSPLLREQQRPTTQQQVTLN
jgi:hypothetical protein